MARSMQSSVEAAVHAVAPNPALMSSMTQTTEALTAFTESVDGLRARLQAVERQEVERLVRIELEKLLSRNIVDRDGKGS